MRITALSGGIGGARFIRGLLRHLAPRRNESGVAAHEVSVIGNTADDISLFGLRVCPDLDTLMYTLGAGIDDARGWGRSDEGWRAKEELAAYGAEPGWFGLGDRDLATHIVRTQLLAAGHPLSSVTARLCARWRPGVRLLPMSDDRIETHIVIADPEEPTGRRTVHFQEYWVRMQAAVPALEVIPVGIATSVPAPGVLDAIADTDLVLLPPSNPVVSIGTILGVPGIRDAVARTRAPVVGLSPIVRGAPVRGMADAVLAAIGVDSSAAAVAAHYGSRSAGGILDGWLVDEADTAAVQVVEGLGIACRAVPLLMHDVATTAAMAGEALAMAGRIRA